MAGGGVADRFAHDIVTVQRYQQILAAEAARREQERRRPWTALRSR
jgi:hypothetical protein